MQKEAEQEGEGNGSVRKAKGSSTKWQALWKAATGSAFSSYQRQQRQVENCRSGNSIHQEAPAHLSAQY